MTETPSMSDVKQFILEHFLPGEDPGKLTADTPLVTGGIVDSLGMLDIVTFLEERYHLDFEAHEVDPGNFDTLALIDAMVRGKLAKTGG